MRKTLTLTLVLLLLLPAAACGAKKDSYVALTDTLAAEQYGVTANVAISRSALPCRAAWMRCWKTAPPKAFRKNGSA